MTIYIANDYNAYKHGDIKAIITAYLRTKGHLFIDLGCTKAQAEQSDYGHKNDTCDYAHAAQNLSDAIAVDPDALGIAICGSGIGIAMACNALQNLYCVPTQTPSTAKLSREHNGANVLALNAYDIAQDENAVITLLDAFITSQIDDVPRHARQRALLIAIKSRGVSS